MDPSPVSAALVFQEMLDEILKGLNIDEIMADTLCKQKGGFIHDGFRQTLIMARQKLIAPNLLVPRLPANIISSSTPQPQP